MKTKKLLYILTPLWLSVSVFSTVLAGDDPLNKPHIWKKLVGAPDDEVLWSRYLSKPWVAMSPAEKAKIAEWKSLISRSYNEDESVEPFSKGESVIFDQVLATEVKQNQEESSKTKSEKAAYVKQLEKLIVSEPYNIRKLRENPKENFWLLDEAFGKEFKKLGISYLSYKEAYPDGDYNYAYWIEEKSEELRYIQRQHFEKLKGSIIATTP